MNNNILYFVVGLGIGAAGGIIGSKKYFEKKYAKLTSEHMKEYAREMEEYYGRVDEYARGYSSDEIEEDDQNEEPKEDVTEEQIIADRMDPEKRREIKEKLNNNRRAMTDYAAMYRSEREAAESESPQDDNPEDNQNDDFVKTANEYHQANKNKPPKIISVNEYENLPPHIDHETMYFYQYDEILATEEGDEIEDPETLIGNTLYKYGFAESDESIIFVMNYGTDTCYEIQKVRGEYGEG